MSVADREPHREPGRRSRTAFLTAADRAAYLASLLVGVSFPLLLPLTGVPREVIGPEVFAGCALASLLVARGHLVLQGRVVRRRLAGLSGGLEAVTRVVREGTASGVPSGWAPGSLRALALPVTPDEVGRTAGSINELIDVLETEHAFRAIVDASGDLVVVLDASARITFVSESVTADLGRPAADLLGHRGCRHARRGLVQGWHFSRMCHL